MYFWILQSEGEGTAFAKKPGPDVRRLFHALLRRNYVSCQHFGVSIAKRSSGGVRQRGNVPSPPDVASLSQRGSEPRPSQPGRFQSLPQIAAWDSSLGSVLPQPRPEPGNAAPRRAP